MSLNEGEMNGQQVETENKENTSDVHWFNHKVKYIEASLGFKHF